jgi:hypothetical protein
MVSPNPQKINILPWSRTAVWRILGFANQSPEEIEQGMNLLFRAFAVVK